MEQHGQRIIGCLRALACCQQLGEAAGVESFEFTHMVVKPRLVRGRREIVVAFDGEVARMRAPIEIRVLDKPLYLLQAPGAAGTASTPHTAT